MIVISIIINMVIIIISIIFIIISSCTQSWNVKGGQHRFCLKAVDILFASESFPPTTSSGKDPPSHSLKAASTQPTVCPVDLAEKKAALPATLGRAPVVQALKSSKGGLGLVGTDERKSMPLPRCLAVDNACQILRLGQDPQACCEARKDIRRKLMEAF